MFRFFVLFPFWYELVGLFNAKDLKPFATFLPKTMPKANDLIVKLLTFAPSSRASAMDALAHPYFEGLHDVEEEPEADELFDESFEDWKLKPEQWVEKVIEEIADFQREFEEQQAEYEDETE